MGLSNLINLIFGTIFIFFLISLICSSVFEAVSALSGLRARLLTEWLEKTLPGFCIHLLNNSTLNGLSDKGKTTSYMSSSNFASALVEIITRYKKDEVPTSVEDIKKAITEFKNDSNLEGTANLLPEDFRRMLLISISEAQLKTQDLAEQMKLFRSSVENWFDSMMERITGNYKRWSMGVSFAVAVIVTISLNIDSVAIIQYLSKNKEALDKVVAAADKAVGDAALKDKMTQSNTNTNETVTKKINSDGSVETVIKTIESKRDEVEGYKKQLEDLVPIGWKENEFDEFRNCYGPEIYPGSKRASKILGWLITIFAASLGAPFWYELLMKAANIRNSIKPLTAAEKEAGEKTPK